MKHKLQLHYTQNYYQHAHDFWCVNLLDNIIVIINKQGYHYPAHAGHVQRYSSDQQAKVNIEIENFSCWIKLENRYITIEIA